MEFFTFPERGKGGDPFHVRRRLHSEMPGQSLDCHVILGGWYELCLIVLRLPGRSFGSGGRPIRDSWGRGGLFLTAPEYPLFGLSRWFGCPVLLYFSPLARGIGNGPRVIFTVRCVPWGVSNLGSFSGVSAVLSSLNIADLLTKYLRSVGQKNLQARWLVEYPTKTQGLALASSFCL